MKEIAKKIISVHSLHSVVAESKKLRIELTVLEVSNSEAD